MCAEELSAETFASAVYTLHKVFGYTMELEQDQYISFLFPRIGLWSWMIDNTQIVGESGGKRNLNIPS